MHLSIACPSTPLRGLGVAIARRLRQICRCHSKIGPGTFCWSGRTLFASRFGPFPHNPSALAECTTYKLNITGKFRDCVVVKMGSFRKDIMHSCQLSLVSKDSPQYSIIWLIEILIIGMFSILGMGGVSCYGACPNYWKN